MTDRVKGCTVVFDGDIPQDDVQPLLEAIGRFRGVLTVEPVVTTASDYFAERRVRSELATELWRVLHPRREDGGT